MKREAISQKLIVVGVDGMDPRLTKKYIEEGKNAEEDDDLTD